MQSQTASQAPVTVVSTVVTDRAGRIVELNPAAASLLKISPNGLRLHPRTLELFFCGSRPAILSAQWLATPVASEPITAVLRPLEHRPRPVVVWVQEASDGYLEWTIEPVKEPGGGHKRGGARNAESPSIELA